MSFRSRALRPSDYLLYIKVLVDQLIRRVWGFALLTFVRLLREM